MAHKEFKLPKASDQDFTVPVFDEETKLPVDLSDFAKVFLFAYSKDLTFVKKYSVTVEAGYDTLTIGGTDNNELSFRLLSTDTNLAPVGILYYEVLTRLPDASSVDDTEYDCIDTDQYLCTIQNSITSTLTIP